MTPVPAGGPRLFCFGLGYSAAVLARDLLDAGWRVAGTTRGEARRTALASSGIEAHLFSRDRPLADAGAVLAGTTHLLCSVPPDADGDPVLDRHGADIAAIAGLRWIGYLSTTGVYGDRGGGRVDETTPPDPRSGRSRRRLAAEGRWRGVRKGAPAHIFRLAGIYGPGRSVLDRVRAGTARRIEKPGHLFSRIHVADIAQALRASFERPDPGAVYNLCDDEPAAHADVVAYACRLLGVAPPAPVPFATAAAGMSPMARSFWAENRRVDNLRTRRALGIAWTYPTYREGLTSIAAAEEGL